MARIKQIRCAIMGDGGWGSALAIHLARCGHAVSLWGAFPNYLQQVQRTRNNHKYLPGIALPKVIRLVPDVHDATHQAQLIILAVPSQYLRSTLNRIGKSLPKKIPFVSVVKGLEQQSFKRMSEVIRDELGPVPLASLSGPSIASEVARGMPASVVVASKNSKTARFVQSACMGKALRIYTSNDVVGVELGGALKNPLAIAAGISDGLGLGTNAKAALLSRGIIEMARLGVSLGAKNRTFWGLSGLGDLVTTSLAGRNRWLGEQLGKGRSLGKVLDSTPMVIEGVETAKAALLLARHKDVELPIIEQVHAVLFRNRKPRKALQTLMLRTGKAEH